MRRYCGQKSFQFAQQWRYSFPSRIRRRPSACAAALRPATIPKASVWPIDVPSLRISASSGGRFDMDIKISGEMTQVVSLRKTNVLTDWDLQKQGDTTCVILGFCNPENLLGNLGRESVALYPMESLPDGKSRPSFKG